jgi:hypothetical protein
MKIEWGQLLPMGCTLHPPSSTSFAFAAATFASFARCLDVSLQAAHFFDSMAHGFALIIFSALTRGVGAWR